MRTFSTEKDNCDAIKLIIIESIVGNAEVMKESLEKCIWNVKFHVPMKEISELKKKRNSVVLSIFHEINKKLKDNHDNSVHQGGVIFYGSEERVRQKCKTTKKSNFNRIVSNHQDRNAKKTSS